MALPEAVSHLDKGLELIGTFPKSTERDAGGLALRIPLGTAWLALKGWAAEEVWNSLHPALPLAKALARNDALLPILWGLYMVVMNGGRVAGSFHWVDQMLDTAMTTGDPDLLIAGHAVACISRFYMGSLVEALEHHDKVLSLYEEENIRTW